MITGYYARFFQFAETEPAWCRRQADLFRQCKFCDFRIFLHGIENAQINGIELQGGLHLVDPVQVRLSSLERYSLA
jgi:hypothetical protein